MLFRKKIEKRCSYCLHGTGISNDEVLCIKKGVVPACGKCRKFVYDPCKRVPPKPKALDFKKFDDVDYSL